MVELRLTRRTTFTDRDRDVAYNGPGTFDVPEEAEEQYLGRGMWQPADEFDADEFLDRSSREIVEDIEKGRYDDKLDEIADAHRENRAGDESDTLLNVDDVSKALNERLDERSRKTGEKNSLSTPYGS